MSSVTSSFLLCRNLMHPKKTMNKASAENDRKCVTTKGVKWSKWTRRRLDTLFSWWPKINKWWWASAQMTVRRCFVWHRIMSPFNVFVLSRSNYNASNGQKRIDQNAFFSATKLIHLNFVYFRDQKQWNFRTKIFLWKSVFPRKNQTLNVGQKWRSEIISAVVIRFRRSEIVILDDWTSKTRVHCGIRPLSTWRNRRKCQRN